ncbi:MAG: triphosphoribosyl-dephospho-CoA synthase [Planctomycetes bacterium]|nr:triphosphoribosyl-dephospho-CoA synthase [Planctomycetota bacterium]
MVPLTQQTSIDACLAEQIRRACILEATARKPGNVHPEAAFADLTWHDFVLSAEAVAPVLARTRELGVGRATRDAVLATRQRVSTNTNLGIILLIAPLAAVPTSLRLVDGIGAVLAGLSLSDTEMVYEAIRLAQPGGLGKVPDQDIQDRPTQGLVNVMKLAAERDLIARQYVENFSLVLNFAVPYLASVPDFATRWEPALIGLQLELLSRHRDSLIRRKCGAVVADEASRRARQVLQTAADGLPFASAAIAEFDGWLRGDAHRRNPGTTADLIAASLFAAMREGVVPAPADWAGVQHKAQQAPLVEN